MDTYYISADCTSLRLCSYQYVRTRCLEGVSSEHVGLHSPEVKIESLLGAPAAEAGAPLQSLGVPYGTGLPLSSGILLLYGLSSMYRGLLMTPPGILLQHVPPRTTISTSAAHGYECVKVVIGLVPLLHS